MTARDAIQLLGGIALFLYGMSIMGSGLERVAGGKMQSILQKLTASTLRGVLLGALITAVIQSSAGTIVIVIGLVNSGIMALPQAVGVIMGANIGTTVTGQLIRLADISGDSLLLTIVQPRTFAPIVAFVGAILYVFFSKPSRRNVGQIMMGFGILFTGMFQMEGAVAGLKESALFVELFTSLQNPILGVLAGIGATVAIQSSSASIGILQALSSTGAVTFGSAFPIILGAHVGTAFTPLMASAGASRTAKRSAVIDLLFNFISSAVYLVAVSLIQYTIGIPFWNSVLDKGSIANLHTFSTVLAALCMLPFGGVLVRLAEMILPERENESPDLTMPVLDERLFTSPAVAIQQARNAVEKMGRRAAANYGLAMGLLEEYKEEVCEQIEHREDLIDRMEVSISNYLIKISDRDLNERESHRVSDLLGLVTEFERVGDYVINITEQAREMKDGDIHFSPMAQQEMNILYQAIREVLDLTLEAFSTSNAALAARIEPLEQTIDSICDTLRQRHIERLKEGTCQIDAGIRFLDVLTNLERISDHCSNVGARIVGSETGSELDAHALRESMHRGDIPGYSSQLADYHAKYLDELETLTAAG